MPSDQNSSQNRRSHYHRGRRGADRRGTERRHAPAPEASHRDNVDVEQIMREIRSRISSRHGVDLSTQQIQELAARRLEAILEPRHVKPALLEQMRRAAGERIEVPSTAVAAEPPFDEARLYESHRGIVATLRRLLNPLLKLLFNPTPIAQALSAQAARNNAAAQREAELYARQAEWNALHYEILQRLVTENARSAIEVQTLLHRMEALEAKLDFNERRVRGMELSTHQSRPAPRPADAPAPESPAPSSGAAGPTPVESGDGARRRRRRRRGRRSGVPGAEGPGNTDANGRIASGVDGESDTDGDEIESPDTVSPEHAGSENSALEPAHHFSLLQPAERYPSSDTGAAPSPSPVSAPSQSPPPSPAWSDSPSASPSGLPSSREASPAPAPVSDSGGDRQGESPGTGAVAGDTDDSTGR